MSRWTHGNEVCLFGWLECCQLDKQESCCFSAEKWWVCVASAEAFLYVCGTTWLCSSCRGQSGHSVTTDGQEKPQGHLKSHRQCTLHTVRMCVCVCMCLRTQHLWVILQYLCVNVCSNHNSVAHRSCTTPPLPSHATNATHFCLSFPPNHQISHTNSHTCTHTHHLAKQKQICLYAIIIREASLASLELMSFFCFCFFPFLCVAWCAVLLKFTHWKDKHSFRSYLCIIERMEKA